MERSIRFDLLANRDINKETFVEPWPEAGLIVADSPYDPGPSISISEGKVIELDGKPRADFDALDLFIVAHALDLDLAESAMAIPSKEYARMLADINVPRKDISRLIAGCTPAKLTDIIRHMNVLEMMMGLAKMRVRRMPANQAHVTNWREHPALLAADAAEAALRGFAEVETTVRVARFAPFKRAGHSHRHANWTWRCLDAVLGGRSAGLAAGDERADQLRRNAIGLRHRDDLR